jgi:hypothetical protein
MYGYVRLTPRGVSPDARFSNSVNADVTAQPPTIYRDAQGGSYAAIASWTWKTKGYLLDLGALGIPTCGHSTTEGGPDGFAVMFSKSLKLGSYSVTYSGTGGISGGYGTVNSSTASSVSTQGVGFSIPDRVGLLGPNCTADLNTYQGHITVGFGGTGTCQSVYGFSKFNHTWSNTSLTGISIGPKDIGFSWNTTSNQWTSASQPGVSAAVC